jgi:hypothetical protein
MAVVGVVKKPILCCCGECPCFKLHWGWEGEC